MWTSYPPFGKCPQNGTPFHLWRFLKRRGSDSASRRAAATPATRRLVTPFPRRTVINRPSWACHARYASASARRYLSMRWLSSIRSVCANIRASRSRLLPCHTKSKGPIRSMVNRSRRAWRVPKILTWAITTQSCATDWHTQWGDRASYVICLSSELTLNTILETHPRKH